VYTAGEIVPNDLSTLFVLNSGVVMVGDEVRSNRFKEKSRDDQDEDDKKCLKCLWGKDFLLRNIALKEQTRVLAVTYIDVYELRSAELRRTLAVEKRRPEVLTFQSELKREQVGLGMARAVVRLATVVSKAQTIGRAEFRRQLLVVQSRADLKVRQGR
jgi:hypothetical protein